MENKANATVHQVITDRIIAMLEKGTVPWRKPWRGGVEGSPRNVISKRAYRGINALLLNAAGFEDPRFVSFKQAMDLGGHVRKSEKGWPIVFFKKIATRETKHLPPEEQKGFALLRYSTVFNVSQCEGLNIEPMATPVVEPDYAKADAMVKSYLGRADAPSMRTGGDVACYVPSRDLIIMPPRAAFDTSAAHYYSTTFHELGHSTGAACRLDRKAITDPIHFGSHQYSEEELVAEMTACFLSGETGIVDETIENSASYLGHWLGRLKGEPKMVLHAAAQAQKAADLIAGRSEPKVEESEAA